MRHVRDINIPLEKYSSGRRGAPAKGIGRETGARVQIPPSPFFLKKFLKRRKLVLTLSNQSVRLSKLSARQRSTLITKQ